MIDIPGVFHGRRQAEITETSSRDCEVATRKRSRGIRNLASSHDSAETWDSVMVGG